eukprot:scaffold56250_cov34-Tisochrysis_lutea.AAC.1
MLSLCSLLACAASPQCEAGQCGEGVRTSACPLPAHHASDPVLALAPSNLYLFNAAQHSVALLRVSEDSSEQLLTILAPGIRKELSALSGELFRARAHRPGHPTDQQLLLEHHVDIVKLKDCQCDLQPEFVDVRGGQLPLLWSTHRMIYLALDR